MMDRTLPPSLPGTIGDTRRRLLAQEQRLDRRGWVVGGDSLGNDQAAERATFSYFDLVMAVRSEPWWPSTNRRVRQATAKLGTAGSSTTSVRLALNGTNTGSTISLGSGETTSGPVDFNFAVGPDDVLTAIVTIAGTAAEDLTVIVELY